MIIVSAFGQIAVINRCAASGKLPRLFSQSADNSFSIGYSCTASF